MTGSRSLFNVRVIHRLFMEFMIMIIHGYSQISETLRFNTEYVGCSAKIAAESFALAGERTEAHLEKWV